MATTFAEIAPRRSPVRARLAPCGRRPAKAGLRFPRRQQLAAEPAVVNFGSTGPAIATLGAHACFELVGGLYTRIGIISRGAGRGTHPTGTARDPLDAGRAGGPRRHVPVGDSAL